MDVLIAYHGMARGSPCVVPSWGKISTPPQVNNLEGLLYMLMIYMEISWQVIWMLLASTNRILSVPSSSKIWAMACMATSASALWPTQICRGPAARMISSFKALFTRGGGGGKTRLLGLPKQEGYPSTCTFLLFTRVYKAGRLTLASGLPCPACKRSAGDNSPTLDNFPPLSDRVTLPVKFACKPELTLTRYLG